MAISHITNIISKIPHYINSSLGVQDLLNN